MSRRYGPRESKADEAAEARGIHLARAHRSKGGRMAGTTGAVKVAGKQYKQEAKQKKQAVERGKQQADFDFDLRRHHERTTQAILVNQPPNEEETLAFQRKYGLGVPQPTTATELHTNAILGVVYAGAYSLAGNTTTKLPTTAKLSAKALKEREWQQMIDARRKETLANLAKLTGVPTTPTTTTSSTTTSTADTKDVKEASTGKVASIADKEEPTNKESKVKGATDRSTANREALISQDMDLIGKLPKSLKIALGCYANEYLINKPGLTMRDVPKANRIHQSVRSVMPKGKGLRIAPSKSVYNVDSDGTLSSNVVKAVNNALARLEQEFDVKIPKTATDKGTSRELIESRAEYFGTFMPFITDSAGKKMTAEYMAIVSLAVFKLFEEGTLLSRQEENYRLAVGYLLALLVQCEAACFP
jgi:hypothetical protein